MPRRLVSSKISPSSRVLWTLASEMRDHSSSVTSTVRFQSSGEIVSPSAASVERIALKISPNSITPEYPCSIMRSRQGFEWKRVSTPLTTTERKSRTRGSRRVRSVTTIIVSFWPIDRFAAPKAEVNEANMSSLTGPPAPIATSGCWMTSRVR